MGDVRVSEAAQVAEAAVIRPGDTLVVRLPSDTPVETLAQVADGLRERLPEVKVLIINAEDLVVYRPAPPEFTVDPAPVAQQLRDAVRREAARQRPGAGS